jgi:hypothetical protein
MEPSATGQQAMDRDHEAVHDWRVSQLVRLGLPGTLAEVYVDRIDWQQVTTGRIEDLMEELRQQYTIVIVTHNMQQATRVSHRTAFFSVLTDSATDTRTGILIEHGPTRQIFEDPRDSRTQAYVTGRIG